jgi:putative hemolysin
LSSKNFIDVKQLIASKNPKLAKWLPGFIIRYLERILHQKEINDFIKENGHLYDQDFCDAVMRYFSIKTVIVNKERIPETGPVILAMNHPLGGMDAIALISGLKDRRKDLKFIVNDLLMNLTNLKNMFVGVNKHGKNDGSVRQTIQTTFESENAVCIFPAGLVSRKVDGKVQDLVWKKTFVTYAKSLDRTIIPIHIEGELSNFFYRLANLRKAVGIKANIEMLYLSNELFKQYHKTITFTVGEPIKLSEFGVGMNEFQLSEAIRQVVHNLKQ